MKFPAVTMVRLCALIVIYSPVRLIATLSVSIRTLSRSEGSSYVGATDPKNTRIELLIKV